MISKQVLHESTDTRQQCNTIPFYELIPTLLDSALCIFTSLLLVYVIDIELKFDEIRESTLLYLRAQTVVHVPKRDYLLYYLYCVIL